jgi:hypothetical protein
MIQLAVLRSANDPTVWNDTQVCFESIQTPGEFSSISFTDRSHCTFIDRYQSTFVYRDLTY